MSNLQTRDSLFNLAEHVRESVTRPPRPLLDAVKREYAVLAGRRTPEVDFAWRLTHCSTKQLALALQPRIVEATEQIVIDFLPSASETAKRISFFDTRRITAERFTMTPADRASSRFGRRSAGVGELDEAARFMYDVSCQSWGGAPASRVRALLTLLAEADRLIIASAMISDASLRDAVVAFIRDVGGWPMPNIGYLHQHVDPVKMRAHRDALRGKTLHLPPELEERVRGNIFS